MEQDISILAKQDIIILGLQCFVCVGTILPTPSFLKKVFRKVPDAEGRVLDPFECGGMDVMEGLRLYQESGLSKDLGFLLQSV